MTGQRMEKGKQAGVITCPPVLHFQWYFLDAKTHCLQQP